MRLPPTFAPLISKSIKEQLDDYYQHAPSALHAPSSAFGKIKEAHTTSSTLRSHSDMMDTSDLNESKVHVPDPLDNSFINQKLEAPAHELPELRTLIKVR